MGLTIKTSKEQEERFVYNYTVLKLTQTESAEKAGIASRGPIRRILKDRNIPIRGLRDGKVKNPINKQFFKRINTIDRAYIYGFICADGCNDGRGVKITLERKDRYLLEKIKKTLNHTLPIKDFQKPLENEKIGQYSLLQIMSMEISEDLTKLGCIRNKNTKLSFDCIEKVPPKLKNHFLRGYFDGDGCISIPLAKVKKWYVQHGNISFAGTTEFCKGLQKYLKEVVGISTNFSARKHSANSAAISACGRIRIKNFYDYLYNNCGEWYLKRKKDKFEEYFRLMRIDFSVRGIDISKIPKKTTPPKFIGQEEKDDEKPLTNDPT